MTAEPGVTGQWEHHPANPYTSGDDFASVFREEMIHWVIPASADRPSRNTGRLNGQYSVDAPDQSNDLVGLAMSGGGIRAATFSLGVTQAMAHYGVLDRVDYMSTVSGGGYLGSSISALIHHRLQGSLGDGEAPGNSLTQETSTTEAGKRQAAAERRRRQLHRPLDGQNFPFAFDATITTYKAESPAVRHLREYSNFMAPRIGLLDTQTWRIILRLVGFQILALLTLILPPVVMTLGLLTHVPETWWNRSVPLATPWAVILPTSIGGGALALFIASATVTTVGIRFQKSAQPGIKGFERVCITTVLSMVLVLVLLFGLQVYDAVRNALRDLSANWVGSFEQFLAAGGLTYLAMSVQAVLTGRGPLNREETGERSSILSGVMSFVYTLVGYVVLLSLVFTLFRYLSELQQNQTMALQALILVSAAWTLALLLHGRLAFFLLNGLALHSFYRARLNDAYILRETDSGVESNADVPLGRLQLPRKWEGHSMPDAPDKDQPEGPYHIISGALNIAGSTDIGYLGRKADSFFFSRYFTGSSLTGFADTHTAYPNMSLSAATAISGAAVSPNMGTHTGTLLAVLLTLLNVRLGYWLENPSKLGPKRTQPRTLPPLWYFVKDMFGAAGGNDDYVSVSDGGHFDNSGIYELVRRRCRYVVFVDSAGEASPANVLFDTVGNAARLVRIDFGVDIEIDLGPVTPDPRTGRTPANFAIGKIIYPRSNRPGMTSAQVDADREGVFILLRSTLTDDPPVPDLEAYRRINSSFPSDPTTRLFFDEAQFEAYRALGYNIGREAFRGHFPPTQDDATCFRNMTNSHAQTGRNVAPVTERGSISPAVAGAFR